MDLKKWNDEVQNYLQILKIITLHEGKCIVMSKQYLLSIDNGTPEYLSDYL